MLSSCQFADATRRISTVTWRILLVFVLMSASHSSIYAKEKCNRLKMLVAGTFLGLGFGAGYLSWTASTEDDDAEKGESKGSTDVELVRARTLLRKARNGENAQPLPVDLSGVALIPGEKSQRRPRIVFLPEKHSCEQCDAQVESHITRFQQDEIVLATERTVPGRTNIGFGIEEPRTRLLGGTVYAVALKKEYLNEFLFSLIYSGELGEEIWQKTKRALRFKTSDPEIASAVSFVDFMFTLGKGKSHQDLAELLNLQPPPSAIDKVAAYALKPVMETFPKDYEFRSNWAKLEAALTKDPLSQEVLLEMKHSFNALVMYPRDREMAQSVLKLYASQAGPNGKDLYINMGGLHLPGMYYYLRTSLDKAGGTDIQISVNEDSLDFKKVKEGPNFPLLKEVTRAINESSQVE